MNQKIVRYIGLFSLILAIASIANANNIDTLSGISINSVSEDTQESGTGLNTGSANKATENDGTGINISAVTENTQGGIAGISVNNVTENTQDGTAGINTNNVNGATQENTPTVVQTVAETPVVIPVITSSSGDGSSSSGGSSRRLILSVQNTPSVATTLSTCPLVTSYMKLGANNNSTEVRNLQSFLRNTQEVDVDLTGVYDVKTENAVKLFQTRYANDILAPWGATAPSGVVSITTQKKLNDLVCKKSSVLSASELATIDAYKQGQVSGSSSGTNEGLDLSGQNIVGTATSGPELSVNGQDANTAAVANISIFGRFWNFLKSLF